MTRCHSGADGYSPDIKKVDSAARQSGRQATHVAEEPHDDAAASSATLHQPRRCEIIHIPGADFMIAVTHQYDT